MSPDQINIAIAEYCGLPIDICRCGDGPNAFIHSVACEYAHMFSPMAEIPDYHHDLNAMHEVECSIQSSSEWDTLYDYGDKLREMAGCTGPRGGHFVPNGLGIFAIANLTAAQRAEAFLRTVGRWEGGE